MSDGGKGDKRRPENEAKFMDGYKKIFGEKKPKRGRWVWDKENKVMVPYEDYVPDISAPMIMPDIQPYQSMIDGRMITSRSTHREHLKANGCIEVGNETKHLKTKPITPPPGLKKTVAEVAYHLLKEK